MTATDPIDEARLSLSLSELRLPAIKHMWSRWYCNLTSGNSACAGAARPCWGMPRRGRLILASHGVAKPPMEKREQTNESIRWLSRSWNS